MRQLTLGELLEKAIQREVELQRLYNDLRRKVTEEAAKDVFQALSQQEHGHQQLLDYFLSPILA